MKQPALPVTDLGMVVVRPSGTRGSGALRVSFSKAPEYNKKSSEFLKPIYLSV